MKLHNVAAAALAVLLGGCAEYSWTSRVPADMRTVCVPVFRNESDVTELGAVAARQVLREFQRNGTFTIASREDAAIEVQGVVKSARSGFSGGDRRSGLRMSEYDFRMEAVVSVVDRLGGRVLVDNRVYKAETTFAAGHDLMTAMRNASGRLAEDLARQVVDDVLDYKW